MRRHHRRRLRLPPPPPPPLRPRLRGPWSWTSSLVLEEISQSTRTRTLGEEGGVGVIGKWLTRCLCVGVVVGAFGLGISVGYEVSFVVSFA
jgi:hypothetical protein